jgi:group I intron endonuclease
MGSNHCVYKLTNVVNGKVYIGKAKDPKARWSKHVSSARLKKRGQYFYLQASINKYGPENFRLETIEILGSAEEAYARESYWIGVYKSNDNKFGMNLTTGGDGSVGHSLSKEARDKISKAQTGRKMSEVTRRAIVKANTGRVFSEEHKRRISVAQRGPKNHRYGKKITDDHKAAVSRANSGKIVSTETRAKMRAATTKRFENNPMPEESRQKMRAAKLGQPGLKGIKHPQAKLTENDVVQIRELHSRGVTQVDLSRRFGVCRGTIGKIVHGHRWKHIAQAGNKSG